MLPIIVRITTFAAKAIAIAKPLIAKCMVLLKNPKTVDTLVNVIDATCRLKNVFSSDENLEQVGERVLKAGDTIKYEECNDFAEYKEKLDSFDVKSCSKEFSEMDKKVAGIAYSIHLLNHRYDTDIVPILEVVSYLPDLFNERYIDELINILIDKKVSPSKYRDFFKKNMKLEDTITITDIICKVEEKINHNNRQDAIRNINKLKKEAI